ncbi:MAG: TetR/AcrR family transcriptional regulator [Gammaproteobacteria bacterium]
MTNSVSDRPARERILLTAHDLFYRDGIRATGVDKVIAEAGVTKVTFYRHFPSKNDLIRTFLDYRHQRWITWFKEALQRNRGHDQGLMALIPTLQEWFQNPVYRGCAFINIAAELGNSLPDALSICCNHKRDMVALISELLPANNSRTEIAKAVAVAVDGAIVRAQMEIGQNGEQTALKSLAVILKALNSSSWSDDIN